MLAHDVGVRSSPCRVILSVPQYIIDIPDEWSAMLADHPDMHRARSLTTSGEDLDILASSLNTSVRVAVARNIGTQKATIVRLLADVEWRVRAIALQHRCLNKADTKADLDALILSEPRYVLQHRHATAELIEVAYGSADIGILQLIAGHRRTPLEILATLATHEVMAVRHAVFLNQSAPSSVIQLGIGDADFNCRVAIATHRNLTDELAMQLMNDSSLQVLHNLARNRHISEETLVIAERKLQATVDHRKKYKPTPIRKRAQTIVSEEITWDYYQRCVDDPVAGVRIAIKLGAFEQGLIDLDRCVKALGRERMVHLVFAYVDLISPMKALEVMTSLRYDGYLKGRLRDDWVQDRDVIVAALKTKRAEIAWDVVQNVDLDAELLELLAHCARLSMSLYQTRHKGHTKWTKAIYPGGICDTFIPQVVVALHPKTAPETLNLLRKSRSAPVRAALVPKMNVDELVQAAASKMPLVRTAVAAHPKTPDSVFITLAMDSDEGVRAAVLGSKRATDEIRALAKLSSLAG